MFLFHFQIFQVHSTLLLVGVSFAVYDDRLHGDLGNTSLLLFSVVNRSSNDPRSPRSALIVASNWAICSLNARSFSRNSRSRSALNAELTSLAFASFSNSHSRRRSSIWAFSWRKVPGRGRSAGKSNLLHRPRCWNVIRCAVHYAIAVLVVVPLWFVDPADRSLSVTRHWSLAVSDFATTRGGMSGLTEVNGLHLPIRSWQFYSGGFEARRTCRVDLVVNESCRCFPGDCHGSHRRRSALSIAKDSGRILDLVAEVADEDAPAPVRWHSTVGWLFPESLPWKQIGKGHEKTLGHWITIVCSSFERLRAG